MQPNAIYIKQLYITRYKIPFLYVTPKKWKHTYFGIPFVAESRKLIVKHVTCSRYWYKNLTMSVCPVKLLSTSNPFFFAPYSYSYRK